MISLVCWLVFGLIVGAVARWLYPVESDQGPMVTLAIGVAGSFVGGLASYLLSAGHEAYRPAGLAFSILGGVACCAAWAWYSNEK